MPTFLDISRENYLYNGTISSRENFWLMSKFFHKNHTLHNHCNRNTSLSRIFIRDTIKEHEVSLS